MEKLLSNYDGLYLVKDVCHPDQIMFHHKSKRALSEDVKREMIEEVYGELIGNWDKYLSSNGYESIELNVTLKRIYLW